MIVQLIKPEILELLARREWLTLKESLADVPAADIAELLEDLDENDAVVIFRFLRKQQAADVFAYLSPSKSVELLGRFNSEQFKDVIAGLSPDDAVALMEELPGHLTQMVFNTMEPDDLADVKKLLGYPENSVGRLMTPKYVRVKKYWSVDRALVHVRKWGRKAETVNVIYVVDEQEKLIDDLTLNQLILALPSQTIESIMDETVVALNAYEDQEEAVKSLAKYDRVALPVVDSEGVLVGIVTVDDILDVAEEETTEDMQLMAGMEALDDSYTESSIFQMVRKRAGWLFVLFVGQIFTATAMGSFEHIIGSAVFLSLFIPMIISSGGNSGSQAATLIIRALSTDDLSKDEWGSVMRRELISGALLGGLLAVFGFVIILVYGITSGETFDKVMILSALTISFSLLGVVLFGNITGAMLPFLLSKLGLDPAVTSAPFVSTLVDVTGILIYFSIAIALLKGVLF